MVLQTEQDAVGPRLIKEGDLVIVYEAYNSIKSVHVEPKGQFSNRFGNFAHKDWIGRPFGSKVYCKGGARGWVHLLAPTPELWTLVLKHRTQILYVADISLVCMHLDLRPGSVVLESGTGSGSLTHALARAVAPTGHVHTFEFHAVRAEEARKEFAAHQLEKLVTVTLRNIEEKGFPEDLAGKADGVFLDLPGPWKVISSAAQCLKPDGKFCAFSPCIEQVQRTVEALDSTGFTDIITLECLLRNYDVFEHKFVTDILGDSGGSSRRDSRKRPREDDTAAAAAAAEEPAAANGHADGETAAENAAETVEAGGTGAAADGEGGACVASAEGGSAGPAGDAEQQQQTPSPSGSAAGDAGKSESGSGPSTTTGEKQQQQQNSNKRGGGREGAGPSAAAGAAAQQQLVVTRPSEEARGHTGYLTFARKFVVTGAGTA